MRKYRKKWLALYNEKMLSKGKFKVSDMVKQALRTGETRMISIHAEEKNPQFISTNRHIMQGLVEMTILPTWHAGKNILTGKSKVIGGETYKVVIALNGHRPASCSAKNAKTKIEIIDKKNGLAILSVTTNNNKEVEWSVAFKK